MTEVIRQLVARWRNHLWRGRIQRSHGHIAAPRVVTVVTRGGATQITSSTAEIIGD